MAFTEQQIKTWQSQVKTAYYTKIYQGSFDMYWDITSALRTDESVDWEAVKKIKRAIWEELNDE